MLGKAQRRGQSIAPEGFKYPFAIKLKPLPCWVSFSNEEQKKFVRELLHDIEREAKVEREGRPVLGIRAIILQNPLDKPKTIKRSEKPICHATTEKVRDAYKQAELTYIEDYRIASEAYRNGQLTANFPEYAFRPSLPPLNTHSPPEHVA